MIRKRSQMKLHLKLKKIKVTSQSYNDLPNFKKASTTVGLRLCSALGVTHGQ